MSDHDSRLEATIDLLSPRNPSLVNAITHCIELEWDSRKRAKAILQLIEDEVKREFDSQLGRPHTQPLK